MVSRVLVTGSSGMLGSHVADRFAAEGHEVVGLDIAPRAGRPGIRQIQGDVRDPATVGSAMRGADLLVHCVAGLPSYAITDIQSITVDGTRTVMQAARQAGVARVVHISSTAVYGLPSVVPTPETHPYAPVDPYSRAKAAAEQLAARFRGAGPQAVSILRPKTFVGPGRMGLFSMLFEWAEEGRNFPVLGGGDVRIQMLAIDDLVEAVWLASTAPAAAANDTFNVGATEFGTLRDDFQAVLDAAGHGKRVVSIPAAPTIFLLQLLARARLSPVYGRLLHKLRNDSFVQTDRIRQSLGFSPAYSNRAAILRTYRWWQGQPMADRTANGGRTSRDPWRQGALALAKAVF